MVAAFYFVYSFTSDLWGGARSLAVSHALDEIRVERWLGVFVEARVQKSVLHLHWLVDLCNIYYATVHFLAPIAILVWLFFSVPDRYLPYRNALAWSTAIALVVFAAFPVAPPRLLPASYGFVDTARVFGGAGRLDSTLLKEAGNQYAAMPSLHVAWAMWVALAGAPATRKLWLKALLVLDPIVTGFDVVVTANHLFLDMAAGVAVALAGVALSRLSFDLLKRWRSLAWQIPMPARWRWRSRPQVGSTRSAGGSPPPP